MCREVLPRLQGGRDGLKMAKVVGLEGVVVTSTDRGSRFDHFRNTARIRHRKPLVPVRKERLVHRQFLQSPCSGAGQVLALP